MNKTSEMRTDLKALGVLMWRAKRCLATLVILLIIFLAAQVAPVGTTLVGLTPVFALEITALPTLDVRRDFGAKGDGKTDDTQAFLKLTSAVNKRDGGVKIVIAPGTYLVGRQVENGRNLDGNVYRYNGIDVLLFLNCSKPIIIEGHGAKLKHPDGMKFGSFQADGEVLNPPLPFWDVSQSATTGYMVGGYKCENITIRGLELDGNNIHYALGGAWGDRDRQCRSYGFYFDTCDTVSVEDVSSHHFGLDGVYIKRFHLKENDAPTPHTFLDSRFEYNGRQGMSWCGGIGLKAVNCKFNHTGYAVNAGSRAPLSNAPGAGVDIEAEDSVCRKGEFINCEFVHTKGPAMYMEAGDNADVSFKQCLFWNFENYSIVPHDPRITFGDCRIYGSAISAYTSDKRPQDAVKFSRCQFEDKPHPTYGQPFVDPYGALLGFDDLASGLLFKDCRFVANKVKGPFLRNPRAGQKNGFVIDGGSLVLRHFNGAPHESVATLQGGVVRNFHIESDLPKTGNIPPGLHIWTNNQTVGDDNLVVDGPHIEWR